MVTLHAKCGEFCPHLKRFFNKIGFSTMRNSTRREIKPTKQKLNPFVESNNTKSTYFSSIKKLNNTNSTFKLLNFSGQSDKNMSLGLNAVKSERIKSDKSIKHNYFNKATEGNKNNNTERLFYCA